MYVLGAQKNRLIDTILLSTHNICFGREVEKLNFQLHTLILIWRTESPFINTSVNSFPYLAAHKPLKVQYTRDSSATSISFRFNDDFHIFHKNPINVQS